MCEFDERLSIIFLYKVAVGYLPTLYIHNRRLSKMSE